MPVSPPAVLLLQPTADPRGVRVAESLGPLVRVLDVPRHALAGALGWAELDQPGLLLLVGAGHELLRLTRSVATAEALAAADRETLPWTRAALVLGHYGSLPVAELASREYWLRLALAYPDDRRAQGGVYLQSETAAWPILPAEGSTWAASALRLLETLGYAFRTPSALGVASAPPTGDEVDRFHLVNGADRAEGLWSPEAFRLLPGSVGRLAGPGSAERVHQDRLVEQGIAHRRDSRLVLVREHRLATAGEAATLILGWPSTGFFVWRRSDGQTLAQLHPLPERA